MLLDATTAKALAVIIMSSTQGIDSFKQEFPLLVEDRGDTWLVKGTPYANERIHAQYCMSHLFIRKDSAEVTGILTEIRMMLTEKEKLDWSNRMTRDDYDRIFGPPAHFEPDGIPDIYLAGYGGLINKPQDAVDYATILMHTKPALAAIPKADLRAEEVDTAKDKVWHVIRHYPDGTDAEVLSFSRKTGRLLSGDL